MDVAKKNENSVVDIIPIDLRHRIQVVDLPQGSPSQKLGGGNLIGVCSNESPERVIDFAISQKTNHICQASGTFFSTEILAASYLTAYPQRAMQYPLSAMLRPGVFSDQVESSLRGFSARFSGSDDKKSVLDAFRIWAEKELKNQTLVTESLSAADEMVMNAIYNAPFVNSLGKLEAPALDSEKVRRGAGKLGLLFAGVHEKQLVIGCIDEYGSLHIDSLLKRIQTCFTGGIAENVNWSGVGGAGIGSFMLFKLSISYHIAVQKGRQTLVFCKIPVGMSARKREEEPKNLHFYEF